MRSKCKIPLALAISLFGNVPFDTVVRGTTTYSEIAVAKAAQVYKRVLCPATADQQEHETRGAQERGPADPQGAKPVVFLPLVEHDPETAGPDRQEANPML